MLDTPALTEHPLPALTQLRQAYRHGNTSSIRMAALTNKAPLAPPLRLEVYAE